MGMSEFPKFNKTLIQLQNEVDRLETTLKAFIRSKQWSMISKQSTKPQSPEQQPQQTPIAIVGMASIFPRSRTLQDYWDTIINKTDCITDVPPSRWEVEDYYDPDPRTPDKTYCKRGGFIPDVDFNPLEFGIPPNQLEVTDISQLLGLVVAKEALADAGYGKKPFNREKTGVILGVALSRQLSLPLGARLQYPVWKKVLKSSGLSDEDTEAIITKIKRAYVDWEPNAFPGMLANIVSGRIANRFDLGGMNCVVDAACASALGALSMAIGELSSGRADMMLTGGVDPDNTAFAYLCFSKTPAVSPSEKVKPFDAESDGMMLGEGVGMLVLKRLEDAERDRDRIYAVIKGIGTSSDGRHKSIYAPRSEGQMRALRRAYESAGFTPDTVGLIEAHGTGTMAGDPAEFAALKAVFSEHNPNAQQVALGSVKSQIGHTKAAAGAASMIKTALALHHKVIPPTINVTKPHPKLGIEDSAFYLSTETRPWLTTTTPRRAGVSSFGFGGTNYHIVLEEYQPEHHCAYRLNTTPQPILIDALTPEALSQRVQEKLQQLQGETGQQDFLKLIEASKTQDIPISSARLGLVAVSATEACEKLQQGLRMLQKQPQAQGWEHPYGIFYRQTGLDLEGKVVALFSGQGSQYLEMGKELVMNFPNLRQTYQQTDQLCLESGLPPISQQVFPPPTFDPDQRQQQEKALQQTEVAQSALASMSTGLYHILQEAGFQPDFVAGHSFGELTALWAAGVVTETDYFKLVQARGQAMATPGDQAGAMLAVQGDVSQIQQEIQGFGEIAIANWNSPQQVVLAGDQGEITRLQTHLTQQGYRGTPPPSFPSPQPSTPPMWDTPRNPLRKRLRESRSTHPKSLFTPTPPVNLIPETLNNAKLFCNNTSSAKSNFNRKLKISMQRGGLALSRLVLEVFSLVWLVKFWATVPTWRWR
jgi:polyketide-type polyunsaturated fatty acid synthase PfaA